MFLAHHMRSVPAEGLVVEIGAGASPTPRADVIVDKYLDEEGFAQRGHERLIIDRPFLQADACRLPFPDKSVCYLVASHVIEHIPPSDIAAFFAEFNRVATAGYIEAPSPLYEHIREIPEHSWFVDCVGQTVFLARREKSPWRDRLEPLFRAPQFLALVRDAPELFATALEWSGEAQYHICSSLEELLSHRSPQELLQQVLEANRQIEERERQKKAPWGMDRIRKAIAWRTRRAAAAMSSLIKLRRVEAPRPKFQWRHSCVCPVCYGPLQIGQAIICRRCGRKYRILSGDIPCFLCDESVLGEAAAANPRNETP